MDGDRACPGCGADRSRLDGPCPACGEADDGAGDGGRVVYEVAAWPVALHARLAALLQAAGIAHDWDPSGDLVVAASDEAAVEALFDQLEGVEPGSGADPLAALAAAHDALARLARDPLDERARRGLDAAVADLLVAPLPFGFDAAVWRSLVGAAASLAGALAQAPAEEVRERAAALRRAVRSWL